MIFLIEKKMPEKKLGEDSWLLCGSNKELAILLEITQAFLSVSSRCFD